MPTRGWQPALAVIALALAMSVVLAIGVPLIDPDEGRNAEVAREMVERHDLVIPHLAGMPYLDKPPGLFWAAAAAIQVLGPRPLAARLPAILAAGLTLLLLARAALREADGRFAVRIVALTAAAPLFAILSAYVIFDMPLTLCVTVVWTGLARELGAGASAVRRAAMFLAVALGILLKGPVMLAWALGGSLAAALLLRRRQALSWLGWWPGWGMVAALAGGWFALAVQRHPEYPHYAFLEESLERMTSGSLHRQQPWWFVPAVLAGGALPWSLGTPWLALRTPRAPGRIPNVDRSESPGGREPGAVSLQVALGFLLFAAIFFTISRSKLVTYLLPAIPPLAWLAAAAWGRTPGAMRRWGVLTAALWLPVALAFGRGPLLAYARSQSGAGLAAAIRASGGGPVRYQACYSPGTDYLLGRRGELIDVGGEETTSNYQLRYRATLAARGLWTPGAGGTDSTADDRAAVWVRPASRAGSAPRGWHEIHRDARFVAYRSGAQP
jgi:4-amino-4-deoxy-L-arabinose transferase-like glycosyltransferase